MSAYAESEVGPVRLDVAGLVSEGGRRRVPVAVTLESLEPGGDLVAFTGPLTGDVEAVATTEGVAVHVNLSGQAVLQCARCQETFPYRLRVSFAEHFRPGAPAAEPAALQGEEDEVPYVTYQGDSIDLDEVIRQHVLLSLPMKPLCRPDCRGLCPACGKNLNEGPCSCEPEGADSRWAPLRDLRLKPSGEG